MFRLRIALAALAAVTCAYGQTRPHNFDLLDVRWSVSLDEPTSSLVGDVTNTLRPTAGAASIQLDFGRLEVDSVTVDGVAATFDHTAPLLTITLPKATDGDKAMAIRVRYHGQPQSGAYFVPASRAFPAHTPVVYTQGEMVDNRFWIPTYDYPDDKATSEGTIDVPEGWFALSNGKLVSKTTKNGRTEFHWKMDKPHATYLISFSAGPYDEGAGSWDGIPINYYVPQGLKDQGEAAFGFTPDIVRFYSKLTGFRYPYAKYTQSAVPDFMFGGMENVTCTTQTINALHPKSTEPIQDTLGLVAHELAHQWFGDTVTCSGWSDAWINEGWATFLPPFYNREKRGMEEFDLNRYDIFQGGLAAHRSAPNRPVVWKGYKDALDMFDNFIYPGGASRMFMLMHEVGEPAFWKATQAYLEQRKYTSFDTPAFFDTYSANLKRDLRPFMRQWFYTAGAPNLTVSMEGTDLVVTQTKPYFTADVAVWVLEGNEWTKKKMSLSGERSYLDLGAQAGRPALVDPECWLMANITSKLPMTSDDIAAVFKAAPNAGEQARIMDTMLGSLTNDQLLALAKTIRTPQVLRRFIGLLKDGSQTFLLDLSRGPDRSVADTAVDHLGALPSSPAVIARLHEIADSDPNESLRQNAFNVLLRMTKDASMADRAWAMDGFRDQYRQIALNWWRQVNQATAREKALEALEKGYPEPTRQLAVSILGQLKDKPGEHRVYDALASVLKETSFGARNNAISALGSYGDKAAIPLLEPFEKAELVFFRRTADEALRKLRAK
ncbi:M1 family aminopeptidase [Fimbriimonas ginsengisoli]|uniref:Aminopeptidase N n=1 Tax=Fimbriimonas ginsengisoli Gsoil 348 TaxID=661478 RepID=A0A068NQG7_FIMGI|nr:M1 family aminopeptidase [Fimbriimonas ginsengisoli]AIE84990.1 HEAT repeat-containing PBS lyase [Fimbriimonas ginsengisoli Gsoil 348]